MQYWDLHHLFEEILHHLQCIKTMCQMGHLPYQLIRISSIITILKSKDLDLVVRAIEKFARLGTSSKVSWKKLDHGL